MLNIGRVKTALPNASAWKPRSPGATDKIGAAKQVHSGRFSSLAQRCMHARKTTVSLAKFAVPTYYL